MCTTAHGNVIPSCTLLAVVHLNAHGPDQSTYSHCNYHCADVQRLQVTMQRCTYKTCQFSVTYIHSYLHHREAHTGLCTLLDVYGHVHYSGINMTGYKSVIHPYYVQGTVPIQIATIQQYMCTAGYIMVLYIAVDIMLAHVHSVCTS